MNITVRHTTHYHYDGPVAYGLTQIRQTPKSSSVQEVLDWQLTVDGAVEQATYDDHHGTRVALFATEEGSDSLTIEVAGTVATTDTGGVMRESGLAPLWLYCRPTELTAAGEGIERLAGGLPADPDVAALHELSAEILSAVAYETGRTHTESTAEETLANGLGVCQDHAHIFIAACRMKKLPARYVSGYLFVEEQAPAEASHAWAEAWLDGLGWVGFDVSNGISPDERYVRIAKGLDYDDVAPTSGVRHGSATESMTVSIQVAQTQQ